MPGLEDLYREIVLDHYRNPRNRGELESPPALRAEGFNPLCGDEVVVYVQLEGDKVADVRFGGQGCSISLSTASMMSVAGKGRSVADVRMLERYFKQMMSIHTAEAESDDQPVGALGDLEALRGVVKFPVRIKCATLCWNALAESLPE